MTILISSVIVALASLWEPAFERSIEPNSASLFLLMALLAAPVAETFILIAVASLGTYAMPRRYAVLIAATMFGVGHQGGIGHIAAVTIGFLIMLHSYDVWRPRSFGFRYALTVVQHSLLNGWPAALLFATERL